MQLSAEVAADLMSIRSLRDFAMHQASVPGAVHRQVAVILLDAAIEQTVFTAAEYRGESFTDRDPVDKPLQRLRQMGLSVNEGVETSRKRLHRARNVVQHAGVGVDVDDVPRWSQATRRFIDAVVSFAYRIDLDNVRYSAAVSNADVRKYLDKAEYLLDVDSVQDAMGEINKAYDITIGIWRGFVNSVSGDLRPRSGHHTELGTFGADDPKVVALQAVTLLTAIAPDTGEAIWFLDARGQVEHLLAEEVRRALLFVFSLIVAVEASPAALREDRRRRTAIASRNTRSDPSDQLTLGTYEIERSGFPGWGVRFALNNVPEPELFDEWRDVLSSALREPEDGWRFYLQDNGTLSGSGPEETFASALDRLESLLEGSEDVVAKYQAKRADEALERQRVEAAFSSAVAAATPSDLPEWFKLTTAPDPMQKPTPVVAVEFGDLWDYSDEVRSAFEAAGHPAYISRGWVVPGLSPEGIPEFVSKLVPELEGIRAKKDGKARKVEESQRPLIDVLTGRGYLAVHASAQSRRR